ncbi:UNVERIFIED_ORG: hypothetical protein GGD51_000620 [Rhizobium esperanzae]
MLAAKDAVRFSTILIVGKKPMDFGSDAKHLLPRRGSLRLFADFPAGLEVVIDCLMEGFLEFSDTVTVKADYIGDTCNPAEKHIVLSLEFDASVRPVVGHGVHGVIRICNSRASRT